MFQELSADLQFKRYRSLQDFANTHRGNIKLDNFHGSYMEQSLIVQQLAHQQAHSKDLNFGVSKNYPNRFILDWLPLMRIFSIVT